MARREPKLTEQQRLFAEGVAKHGELKRAAEEAGFAHPNVIGSRLAQKPHVAAEIERLRIKTQTRLNCELTRRDERTIADAIELQEYLSKVIRGEIDDSGLSLSGDAVRMPAKVRDRTKAAEVLARIQGLMTERRELSGPGGGAIPVAAVTLDVDPDSLSHEQLQGLMRRMLGPGQGGGE